jgi:hypothetical protein
MKNMDDSIDKIKQKPALSGWPMVLAWLAMIIFAFHASTHMVGAGDTWVALACGRHFINNGVDTVEPFSANSHKPGPTEEQIKHWPPAARWIADKVGMNTVKFWHPTGWVNQNWLTHVIFYWLTHLSPFADAEELSFNTLAYWKIAIYILNVICVYYIGRVLGVNPALCAVFACFAMFVGRSFFDIRPAGFSNLLVAAYLLILVLATHRKIIYIWLIVPILVFWCNVHGGYIYAFIMLVPFVIFNFLTSFSKKWFASIGLKGIFHTIGAGFAAFIAMIIFNPFHLTNLTHTFAISLSKHAERWRSINEWHPAFEWNNPVGDEIPFLIMFIIALLLLIGWSVTRIKTNQLIKNLPRRCKKGNDLYKPSQIDLALIVIAALTIYMAVSSRRFIPIAAAAACPVLALFIDQIIRGFFADRNFKKANHFAVPRMDRSLQAYFTLAGVAAVIFFGTWWGLKFKCVYLDPWPTDPELTSIFMRMTASDAKPFYACRFIKDNNMQGKMFNYWTEGGFIAWGQKPDPNNGKTPLQLFMDGRAQAAYERKDFDLWQDIISGGPVAYQRLKEAKARDCSLNANDYRKIGQWLEKQLAQKGVWAVLMPKNQFNKTFTRALEYNQFWCTIFYNNKQKLLVDSRDERFIELFDGIDSGKTRYPDEFSRNLIRAHYRLLPGKDPSTLKQGLELAIKAFEERPSYAPIQKILYAHRFPELRADVDEFCRNYFEKFMKNKDDWLKKSGYHHRLVAALNTVTHLRRLAKEKDNKKLVQYYSDVNRELSKQASKMVSSKRW